MRFDKATTVLRLALDLQGVAEGLSLADIQERCRVSRRTAERLRDAVARLFPQLEEAQPGDTPKRWRLPAGTLNRLIGISAEELSELNGAARSLRRNGLADKAALIEGVEFKLRALIRPEARRRIEPDLEALTAAEGLALRPGPRPRIEPRVIETLRGAILGSRKVRLVYRARGTGAVSRQIVCPYGFLYGARSYLVAYSMNAAVRDYRLFELSRIRAATVTEWPFARRADFSLEEYAARSFGVFQEEPVDVVWRFTPEAAEDAREFLFHPTQEMEDQPDGSLVVRFRAGGLRDVLARVHVG